MKDNAKKSKASFSQRFMKAVEKGGNKLPHPFTIFVILIVAIMVLSTLLSKMGVSAEYMKFGKDGAGKLTKVTVENLLSVASLRALITDFVKTYINFAPLGLVMVMMMGIGVCEQTGLISAAMRKSILGAPSFMVSLVLAFVAINANIASTAGTFFAITVGGAIFKALGRNPRIGMITGFAGASGGFSANLLIAGTDSLLAGITDQAAKAGHVVGPTNPLINWYFMIVATFALTFAIAFVTEKVVSKSLGEEVSADSAALEEHKITPEENRGLKWAGIATLVCIALILIATIPSNGLLRNEKGGILPKSPLIDGIVTIIFLVFVVVGIAYGIGAGKIKSERDIPKLMQKGLSGSISFIVLSLPAAVFIDLFEKSNLTTILAIKGGHLLERLGLNGVPLMILFILLVALTNLFMTSASGKWLILAPIFVPMFAKVGFTPALTQALYRIGDSGTNIISPIASQIPMLLGLFELYGKQEGEDKIGFGSILSLTLPYSIAILLTFTVLIVIWYLIGLPLGPGAYLKF